MTHKFSEKVLYDLKEHSFRHDFGLEALFPCRNRREREQMTLFLDAVELVYLDELMASFYAAGGGAQPKSNRAIKFATLAAIGQLITSARSSKAADTQTHDDDIEDCK
jgi:hypothetical protein